MGPSWHGVKFVLPLARHSALPLLPAIASINESFVKAKGANNDIDPFDPSFVDYASEVVTRYRILVPKLNFDLSTEFRHSLPDNGFELWLFLIRRLDPPEGGYRLPSHE